MPSFRLGEAVLKINRSEKVSFYTHLAGIVAAVIGTTVLLIRAWGNTPLVIVSLVYGLAMSGLFTFSALYHATKRTENAPTVWRKLDHIAIFFMIAGTYTPVSYVFLQGAWRWSILSISWAFVILGILLKVFFLHAPRWASTVLYLLMGWLAIIPLRILWRDMTHYSFFLILGGGVVYSIGAIIYGLKKPNPVPGTFGFHEIFHVLILVAAVMHYIPVYVAVGS
jgi:hemolysin III